MRKYKVYPKLTENAASASPIPVLADDVDLESTEKPPALFWNFTILDGDETITVAGFPFEDVAYFVSEEASEN